MTKVEIRGKEFPLCLTVAALDQINSKCGGLKNLNEFLLRRVSAGDGSETKPRTEIKIVNLVWLLGLLIQEGEENRLVEMRFSGEKPVRRAVPDPDAIAHLLTPGSAIRYLGPVYAAINDSMHQDIEASYEKNGENAELE